MESFAYEVLGRRSDGPIRWGLRRILLSNMILIYWVGVMVQLDGDYDE